MENNKQLSYTEAKEKINSVGVNIVTCGECGKILFHSILYEGDLKCDCGFEDEQCFFPDFIY